MDVDVVNIRTEKIDQEGELLLSRHYMAAQNVRRRVYVCGGYGSGEDPRFSSEVYDADLGVS